MNATLLGLFLDLLELAPSLIADVSGTVNAVKGATDVGSKADAVVAGINHLAATVLPALAPLQSQTPAAPKP
jgi:hypothetical protein